MKVRPRTPINDSLSQLTDQAHTSERTDDRAVDCPGAHSTSPTDRAQAQNAMLGGILPGDARELKT
jgi:hypothetical protein